MKAIKLLGNKKTPTAMARVFMFGRYRYLAAAIPNKAIFPIFGPPVNKDIHHSPIHCELMGLIVPEYHKNISIVAVIKGLTPRTGRQSKRNLLDMGTPITALFTVQERAVEPFKINFTNKLSTGCAHGSH